MEELEFFERLPTSAEPEYVNGYTCDWCKGEFLAGPFYHDRRKGRDACIDCAVRQGKHLPTECICELLVPLSPSMVSLGGAPVAAYRTACRDQIGFLFAGSDEALVVRVNDVRDIQRAWAAQPALDLLSIASALRGTKPTPSSSAPPLSEVKNVAAEYPWISSWMNSAALLKRIVLCDRVSGELCSSRDDSTVSCVFLSNVLHTTSSGRYYFVFAGTIQLWEASSGLDCLICRTSGRLLRLLRDGKIDATVEGHQRQDVTALRTWAMHDVLQKTTT